MHALKSVHAALLWEATVVSRGRGASCVGTRGGAGSLAKHALVQKKGCAHRSMAVACGYMHTLAVAEKGQVLACGCGAHGRLALGDRQDLSLIHI